jgi:adenylosuccinate lyase
MIPRYEHAQIARIWNRAAEYQYWTCVELAALQAQRNRGVVPWDQTDALYAWLATRPLFNFERAVAIRELEKTTQHEVVAYLEFMRAWRGDEDAKWLHFGLTSSDLVDTTLGLRMKASHGIWMRRQADVYSALMLIGDMDWAVLGSTHGQPAEPTSMAIRAAAWRANIALAVGAVELHGKQTWRAKTSGPVGNYAHNPPGVELDVAGLLELEPAGPSSQIVGRSALAMWASSCASLLAAYAKVAHDLRLLNRDGEVWWSWDKDRVGSSAMPHKRNPIEAEQMSGFARIAAGYALMLQEQPLWLERDISNSAPERIAVADMWHIVLRATETMAQVLKFKPIGAGQVYNLETRANAAWSHKTVLDEIRDGQTYEQARELGREVQIESYNIAGDAKEAFLGNHPGSW